MVSATVTVISYPWWDCDRDHVYNPCGQCACDYDRLPMGSVRLWPWLVTHRIRECDDDHVYKPRGQCDCDHDQLPMVRLWPWSATHGETVTMIRSITHVVSETVTMISYPWDQCDCDHDQLSMGSVRLTTIRSTSHVVSATVTMISYPWWDCDHDQLPMVRLWPWSATHGETVTMISSTHGETVTMIRSATHVVIETVTMIKFPAQLDSVTVMTIQCNFVEQSGLQCV